MPSAADEWTDYKQRRGNQIYKLCVVKSDLSIMLDSLEIPSRVITVQCGGSWRIMVHLKLNSDRWVYREHN